VAKVVAKVVAIMLIPAIAAPLTAAGAAILIIGGVLLFLAVAVCGGIRGVRACR
jgi:hypothetical protein